VSAPDDRTVAPGGTIGILGGGQLGRMTAIAAARLGYRCHIFCPDADSPAARVADRATVAAYDDTKALDAFAGAIDVVTYEFENIPAASVDRLSERVPARPGTRPLYLAQDRVREKDFVVAQGIGTAPYRRVETAGELPAAVDAIGLPAILKSAAFGYDGKGQVRIAGANDLAGAWQAMGGAVGILEGVVDFEREISVIAARAVDGSVACYDPVENRHRGGILDETLAPAAIGTDLTARARGVAERLVEALDVVGLLAVEMFVARDGDLLVNELAPRPHNSGHWTIDACVTSQFEQFVRAVAGLPLGDPSRLADARMLNLIGDAAEDWLLYLRDPQAKVHLYGKREARPGRKMGHVTWLRPRR